MPKFIKGAIKHEGRLRGMLHKKPGENISEAELDMLAAKAKKTKNKSLAAAVALARRMKSGDLSHRKMMGK